MMAPTISRLMNGDSPWWARLLVYLGFPAFVALILLGMGAGWIPSPIIQTHALVQDVQRHVVRSHQVDAVSLRALVAICRNTAQSISQRDKCDELADDAIMLDNQP